MIRLIAVAVALLLPSLAWAQPVPQLKPEMALLPRDTIAGLLQQLNAITVLHPEMLTMAVQQAAQMTVACLNDNPTAGRIARQGPDQCTAVTEALAEQTKTLADAQAVATKANKDAADQKVAADKVLADTKAADQKTMIDQVAEARRVAEAPLQARIKDLEAQLAVKATRK